MKTRVFSSYLFAVFVLVAGAAEISPDRYLYDVRYLASPALKGRGSGQPGLEKAARYIEAQFAAAKLQPVPGHRYFQPFPITTDAHLGPANRMEVSEQGRRTQLKLKRDFVPLNFSSAGSISGQLVFVGYGITAPEYHYDDYEGVDAAGKMVLVLRHEPQEFDEKSVFQGKALTLHSQFWSKAANAKRHGARAVILVNDRPNHPARRDDLEEFGHAAGPNDAGIGFFQVKAAVAQAWLAAEGRRLDDLEAGIDKELKPHSFAVPSVTVTAVVDLQRDTRTVRNVAAYLPGQTDEYVIIGAHYDHLGLGGPASLAPSQTGTPHPGADDNASGTAGVLELARWFGSRPKHRRGILFLCFAGEELGLLGSRYWVDHPELPLEKAAAMINLDMIGRISNHQIYVGDALSGTTFQRLLDGALPPRDLLADHFGIGTESGSSDDTSFVSKQVPSLFFFSGLHADYHKPSDTWDKINAPDAATLLAAVGEIAAHLADDPGRPQFVRAEPANPGPVAAGDSAGAGYGPWFGSVPDFGETAKGAKFADVTAGSPAAKAGLRAGDTLIEFDGKPVGNLYDFTYALRTHKPGDEVTVKVLRGGETVETKVTLGERPR
jgi:hypothetical protein